MITKNKLVISKRLLKRINKRQRQSVWCIAEHTAGEIFLDVIKIK